MAVLPYLFIRADADTSVGTGHVTRCLAIAQAWLARGGRVGLLYRSCPQQVLRRFDAEGVELHHLQHDDVDELRQLSADLGPTVLLIDGYHFSPAYRLQQQKIFSHTVLLDDYASELPLNAECVINPQPQIRKGYYDAPVPPKALLGLDYLPLRREFIRDVSEILPLESRNRVLLSLGGTDPARLTLPLSRLLLERLPADVMIDAVIRAQHPDASALDELARLSGGRLQLLQDVDDMASVMVQAGMAVSAAGSTVWELAAMRVPVIVISVAENQRVIGDYPYWLAVLDAIEPETEHVALEAVQSAVALWGDLTVRQHLLEELDSLALGQGSSKICDCLELLITIPKGDGH